MENVKLHLKFKDMSNQKLDDVIIDACKHGEIDTIKYLLTSPQLIYHPSITNNLIDFTCIFDQVDALKLLLNLNKEINIQADIEKPFDAFSGRNNFFGYAYNNFSENIIKYFIFDLKINKIDWIENYKNHHKHGSDYDVLIKKIKHWFDLRDLNKELSDSLDIKEQQRKHKL
jgi:hypothetical protein